jgi:hypothetical protein
MSDERDHVFDVEGIDVVEEACMEDAVLVVTRCAGPASGRSRRAIRSKSSHPEPELSEPLRVRQIDALDQVRRQNDVSNPPVERLTDSSRSALPCISSASPI